MDKKRIIGICVAVAVALVTIVSLFLLLTNTTKKDETLSGVISNYSKKISNLFEETESLNNSVVNSELYFNVDLGSEIIEYFPIALDIQKILNETVYTQTTKLDFDKDVSYAEINFAVKNVDLLNIMGYVTEDNVYVKIKDLLSSFVKYDTDEFDYTYYSATELDIESSQYMMIAFIDAFSKSANNNYFKIENNVKVEINKNSYNTTKYTLKNDSIEDLASSFVDNILNDKKLLDILNEQYGVTKSDLMQVKTEVDDTSDLATISFNVANNEIISITILDKDNEKVLVLENDYENNNVIINTNPNSYDSMIYDITYNDKEVTFKISTQQIIFTSVIEYDADKTHENITMKNSIKIMGLTNPIKFDITFNSEISDLKEELNISDIPTMEIEEITEDEYNTFIDALMQKVTSVITSLELEYINSSLLDEYRTYENKIEKTLEKGSLSNGVGE